MKISKIILAILVACLVFSIQECTKRRRYYEDNDRLSIAKVQREIRLGMTSSEVVEVLGSPNMVTTDDKRRETWVYDKVSTTVQSSSSHHGVWVLLYDYAGNDNYYSSNQRTLTIIIKFNEQGKVRDFAYRTSSF